MAVALPEELKKLLDLQQKRIASMRDKRSTSLLREAVTEARNALRKRIDALKLSAGSPFTLYQHQQVVVQLDLVERALVRQLGGSLAEVRRMARDQSVHDAFDGLRAASRSFRMAEFAVPLPEVTRLVKGDSKLRTVEERRIKQGTQKYGIATVQRIEQTLAQSLLMGESTDAATRRVLALDTWADRYSSAERIARTEFSEAYNAGKRTAFDEAARQDPELWLMWHEHARGPQWAGPKDKAWPGMAAPLDDRVADDSLRLHGQLRRPGQLFVDPETGKRYAHPPNRPNDRATLIPVYVPKARKAA